MNSPSRALLQSSGPVHHNLTLPLTTKPVDAVPLGIFNSTITASNTAEKVISATHNKNRRVFIFNPSTAEWLAWTTRLKGGSTMSTMTATALGGDLNGSPVPPQSQVELLLPFNADLWLAATANGARYQLVVSECG